MTRFRRNASFAAFAATAAGLTWALATGVIVNYPATIRATVNVPSETVTRVQATAYHPNGGTVSASATGAGPLTVDLGVDGGDPQTSDPGTVYSMYAWAYLSNPASSEAYLRTYRPNIVVDNTSATPSVTVPVTFTASTNRVNVSVSVQGNATISYHYINAFANGSNGESYFARASGSNSQSSMATWLAMIPASTVTVNGTVTLLHPDGSTSQRNLSNQTVSTSAGSASASWTIDVNNTGRLNATISALFPPGATVSQYQVHYRGVSSSSSGVSGIINVPASSSSGFADLPPGEYDVYLRTYFASPYSFSDSAIQRDTVITGAVTERSFVETYENVQAPLSIGGFYSNADVTSSFSYLLAHPGSRLAYVSPMNASGFQHRLPSGNWRRHYIYTSIQKSVVGSIINNAIYKYDYSNSAIAVPGSGSFASDAMTLSRASVYFDVVEPAGSTGQIQASNPELRLTRQIRENNVVTHQIDTYAYGTSDSSAQPSLMVAGEPGVHTIVSATALVNGVRTLFRAGGTVVFSAPQSTNAPGGADINLTVPASNGQPQPLLVSLNFSDATVSSHGQVAFTESPLGPSPPAGFRTECEEELEECKPVYYDINASTQWTGQVKVCIRRTSSLYNGPAEEFLKLKHFNDNTQVWESLAAPTDGDQAFVDCVANLSACGCASEAECGIFIPTLEQEEQGETPIFAYRLCGMTTSFSPFAIFQKKVKLTNTVDGVEYTGPTGPPALQQWVAPGDGTYRITAAGARGVGPLATPSLRGGCGAEVTGEFALQEGDVLQILVGQKGSSATNNAGGGGGTFVTKNGVALLIAGGGGGVRSGALVDGRHASLGAAGVAGSLSSSYAASFIAGGTNGGGGARAVSYGAGGGGWSGNGAADSTYGDGGFAFTGPSQGRGGSAKTCASGGLAHGGYGGGGSGNGCYGGGGGGGYSGGGGGRIGGGGGSLNTGLNPTGREGPSACTASGHGEVIIDFVRP